MMSKKIKNIVFMLILYIAGFCMGCSWIFKRKYEYEKSLCYRVDKLRRIIGVLDYWLELKEYEKDISYYFNQKNNKNIAVYGVGYLGKHLIKELNWSGVNIDYIIDRNIEEVEENITIYRPDDILPSVDAVVVTAIADFDEIVDRLNLVVNCPILSLEDIIFNI